jgi:glycosyltransferase involved in cell wall biosynthesis
VTDGRSGGGAFFDPSRRRSLGWQPLRSPWLRAARSVVWRRLPRPLRQRLLTAAFERHNRRVAIDATAAQPISVVGLLSTATGIGEGGRLAGRAFASLGYEVLSVDVSDIFQGAAAEGVVPPPLEIGRGTAILHFNPDNLGALLTLLGRRRLRGKRIIGYWAWELQRIPSQWVPALQEVDEVWTPSRFVAEAVRPFTAKPVRVVPHPVAQGRVGRSRRRHFGMDGRFTALTMFSFASSFPRKNPLAAVEAFRRAFGDAEDRLLILKASDGAEAPAEMAELRAAIDGARNIRLEERRLGDDERLDLIASADALLSLHRSEGFGLLMAEAMLAGVATIATAWSGNLDFMDESSALLVPAQMVPAFDRRGIYCAHDQWAEPDIATAAAHLAALAADPGRFEPMRRAARTMVEERLGLSAFRRAVEPALGAPVAPRHKRFSSEPVAATAVAARLLEGA